MNIKCFAITNILVKKFEMKAKQAEAQTCVCLSENKLCYNIHSNFSCADQADHNMSAERPVWRQEQPIYNTNEEELYPICAFGFRGKILI